MQAVCRIRREASLLSCSLLVTALRQSEAANILVTHSTLAQEAPTADELLGKRRKPARVLRDVDAFLALAARLGVASRDLFSASDVVEGRNTPQVV